MPLYFQRCWKKSLLYVLESRLQIKDTGIHQSSQHYSTVTTVNNCSPVTSWKIRWNFGKMTGTLNCAAQKQVGERHHGNPRTPWQNWNITCFINYLHLFKAAMMNKCNCTAHYLKPVVWVLKKSSFNWHVVGNVWNHFHATLFSHLLTVLCIMPLL